MASHDPDDRPAPTYRSNGSILSDMGQTQQRFEKEQAESRAVLEVKLSNWSELERVLTLLLTSLEPWNCTTNESAFAELTAIYKAVLPTLIAPPKGSSKYIRNLRNEIISTREALGTNSYSKKELKYLKLVWPAQALEKTQELIRRTEKKLAELDDALVDKPIADPIDSMEHVLGTAQTESSKLALLEGQDHVVVRVPVVIVGASITALNKNKIPHHNLGGYAALKDQRVIGVHNSLVERTKKGKAKETIQQAVERLLLKYTPQTGRLSVVNPHPVVAHGGVWFWIGTEHDIDTLRKALGSTLVSPWGFAQ